MAAQVVRSNYLWIDGTLVPWDAATVHASLLGWSTMGAVFEGIKAYWNADHQQLYAWQFREHYARFVQSMRLMRMQEVFTADQLTDASLELVRANALRADHMIRPLAWFKDIAWFGTCTDGTTSVVIKTHPFASRLGTGSTQRACVSSWIRLPDNAMSPRVKCVSNYQNSRMALLEAVRHGYDTVILLNAQGNVTEGPASAFAIVRGGRVITPDISSGILESITRATVIQLCREELDIPVEERPINRSELYLAEEAFFCGTGAEVTPVVDIDGYRVGNGAIGPITARLETLFHDIVRGRTEVGKEMRIPVYDGTQGNM